MEIGEFWQWLKDHDAPNWFVIAFTLIVWPSVLWIVLYYWSRHKTGHIPNLEVSPTPQKTQINGQPYDAVGFTFANHTGSVVYLI
jgi:hypothetical protein